MNNNELVEGLRWFLKGTTVTDQQLGTAISLLLENLEAYNIDNLEDRWQEVKNCARECLKDADVDPKEIDKLLQNKEDEYVRDKKQCATKAQQQYDKEPEFPDNREEPQHFSKKSDNRRNILIGVATLVAILVVSVAIVLTVFFSLEWLYWWLY